MTRQRKTFVAVSVALLGLGFFGYAYAWPKLTLFAPDRVAVNFARMQDIFPAAEITPSDTQRPWMRDLHTLPTVLDARHRKIDIQAFLAATRTNALLVFHDGKLIAESYFNGYSAQSNMTSFSTAKAFVSTLVGVAIKKGWIASLEDQVSAYLPELEGTGWQGVRILDLLQMSSGIAFSEAYDDPSTDAFTIYNDLYIFARGVDAKAAQYPSNGPPGTEFQYASINTHILSWLLRRVSGTPLAHLLERELWGPLGMEHPATWLTDLHGTEIGFWGLNARPSDLARLGQLMLDNGFSGGRQLLPEDWVGEATTPNKPFLRTGQIGGIWGYQHQWWRAVPEERGDFSAIGIWGQFIYVDPVHKVVIVKASADPDFKSHEPGTIELFRSIAKWCAENRQK